MVAASVVAVVTNPMDRISENLIVGHLVKKLPIFYGSTLIFIAVFTRAQQ
jgi:hypothetical protein